MDKRQIKYALHSYHWMVRVIELKQKDIDERFGDSTTTGQYGLESTLPKPKGGYTDPVYFEYLRREEEWRNIEDIRENVVFIQSRINCIKGVKEKAILNRILDGMSLREISRRLGMSNTHIRSVRDSIVDQMHKSAKGAKGSKSANGAESAQLQKENSAC